MGGVNDAASFDVNYDRRPPTPLSPRPAVGAFVRVWGGGCRHHSASPSQLWLWFIRSSSSKMPKCFQVCSNDMLLPLPFERCPTVCSCRRDHLLLSAAECEVRPKSAGGRGGVLVPEDSGADRMELRSLHLRAALGR